MVDRAFTKIPRLNNAKLGHPLFFVCLFVCFRPVRDFFRSELIRCPESVKMVSFTIFCIFNILKTNRQLKHPVIKYPNKKLPDDKQTIIQQYNG